jgi:hypothetical protein
MVIRIVIKIVIKIPRKKKKERKKAVMSPGSGSRLLRRQGKPMIKTRESRTEPTKHPWVSDNKKAKQQSQDQGASLFFF